MSEALHELMRAGFDQAAAGRPTLPGSGRMTGRGIDVSDVAGAIDMLDESGRRGRARQT